MLTRIKCLAKGLIGRQKSGLEPSCPDAMPVLIASLGSVMKMGEGMGRGNLPGQYLGKALGQDSPFPVPPCQHQGVWVWAWLLLQFCLP